MKGALTESEHRFFEEEGYLVRPRVVAKADADELALALRQERARTDSDVTSPYSKVPAVPLFHHPLQWKLRENLEIYRIFAELLGTEKLWVSIDRGKVTVAEQTQSQAPELHWDIDLLTHGGKMALQGLVALTDNPLGHGNFRCIPGFHKHARHFADFGGRRVAELRQEMARAQQREIALKSGDVLIWNAYLPHGNAPNTRSVSRIVQFVRYFPCAHFDEQVREQRIAMIQTGRSHRDLRSGDRPRELFKVQLNGLGRKLAGLDLWD